MEVVESIVQISTEFVGRIRNIRVRDLLIKNSCIFLYYSSISLYLFDLIKCADIYAVEYVRIVVF